jgi:cytochrome c-type biogenesis protein CcmH
MRRLIPLLLVLVCPAAPTLAAATTPKASLTDIENDVMCVSCREPLAVAQSPQALAERSFIRHLIAQGQTKAQIENQLVAQYGPAVLGRPPADGFNLTVYVLPPAILLIGIALLVIYLPRWRARARSRANPPPAAAGPKLDPAEARRLDEDLARDG